ncbi:survival motor neuron protein [Fopius arisanus]|uniref:Survival motor neuron protein n=1 Tax=Fopius arisanus TaxID=64838 RepID=A0A9R1TK27_9HYME|nr:PREDICTED: survival motor neuron protein [Fopius arisanus]
MTEEENVLFLRANGDTVEDIWDDTALIKAYDKAVNLAKEQVAKRLSMETEVPPGKSNKSQNSRQSSKQQNHQKKWTLGSPCRAVYSADGIEYEAIISKILDNDCRHCTVKFVGYGNTERVELSSLRESNGLEAQIAQQKDSDAVKNCENSTEEPPPASRGNIRENEEAMDYESDFPKQSKNFMPRSSSFSFGGITPPAPPLPPHMMARLPTNEADALSSMLMSWYISGFHTGYYHGLKQAQSNLERRKK